MRSVVRRLALLGLVAAVMMLGAVPASAQSSSLVSGQSIMSGVTFDSGQSQRPINWTVANPAPSVVFKRQDGAGIGVGVLGGIVRSSLTGSVDGFDLEDFVESRTAAMLGLWVGGNMNGRVGFVGEFIYLFRKNDVDFDGDGLNDDELSSPAIEIPAVFHVNFGPQDRSKGLFFITLGPVFTINLSEKVKIDGTGDSIDLEDEGFKGADIGALLGAGFEIFRVGFEVRHNWGLRNISDIGGVEEIKTRAWEFLVKFRFN